MTFNPLHQKKAPLPTAAPPAADSPVRLAVDAALDKKAIDPVLLDVRGQASYTDFILVLSGTSDRHVQSLADAVSDACLERTGRRPIGLEGRGQGHWTLIDCGDFIVHVFYHPVREFYDLEGLWCDAPRVALDVPPESRSAPAAAAYSS